MVRIIPNAARKTKGDPVGGASDSTQALGAERDRDEALLTQALYMVAYSDPGAGAGGTSATARQKHSESFQQVGRRSRADERAPNPD
jgi:hypothetical protein